MFGTNKTPTKDAPRIAGAPATQGLLNSMVTGTTIDGTVNAESDIRIDGFLKGTLTCKGKVIIGSTGQIEGEIKAQNAVIEGKFKGILHIEDLLQIKETAYVEGEINTDKLSVSPGAKFNVVSKMSPQQHVNRVKNQPNAFENNIS
ncbi:MAG: polymer-forming cytoskeletal protein [Saprospiraceae bacterium]|nr:polymer-forming cytoskeletal protein [Saprospiraceae bacterium]HMW38743.1 polymer-forming cytoskeletal protein [Saprospiraceae bacterium]HMX88599.1 polymer-forming cytoskeletal protein [Saprospiraceae bacterium]HMZ40179.1 polymer-forming cytoskeletal protein [Saprospiraceae bacterium]HNA63601.1 polymer-forming cytoskeletal protein [Saprospiraceae bacterium]